MEGDATQLGSGGRRKPQYHPTRKRRHNTESGESSEPIRKSPRLQGKAGKPARSSPRTAEALRSSKVEERPRPRPQYKSPTAQVAHDKQALSGRKQQRTEIEEEQPAVATPSHLPWKRARRPFQSQQKANTAFWDSLSTVWLTKRALEEVNRRTAQRASPASPAPLGQCDLRRKACPDQIKHLARRGGPDLCDLRGYPEPTRSGSSAHNMNSSRSTARTQDRSTYSKSTPKTTSTRKSSAYNRNFEQNLIDHSIYPDEYDYPDDRVPPEPDNWGEINDRLAQPRASLSPSCFSERAFREFRRTNARALSEGKVMTTVFPIIAGKANIPNEGDLVFTNLEPLTDGTLVDMKPDYYDGARPEQIDERIRQQLASVIIPSTLQHAPCLPSLFAEGKGPDGSAAVARRQACYGGALGARGIHMLQSYGANTATWDDNAYTISATYYHDGLLKMYTTHPTEPKASGGEPEYHMTQLGGWCMTDSAETFRQGASAFRNARDWTKEQRDKLIAAANGRVMDLPIETLTSKSSSYSMAPASTNEPILLESDTLTDELSRNARTGIYTPYKCLKRGPEKCDSKPDQKRHSKPSFSKAGHRSGRKGRSLQIVRHEVT